ncbi:hypothetical protein ACFPK9_15330 [Rubritalea spongiae]|uniref:hypothetical protein n=1 Tax=Rubritalea spongiae TaxID=430797 RepID=UPI003623EB09
MKLEKVTAEIRPRGRWESIDLGCALVRENYGKVISAWLLTVVPLWFLIIALSQMLPFEEGRPWIAGFLCIWILPFCDRVPLFVISRRLFGEDSTFSELLRALPGMFTRRAFGTLLLGPLDLGRGLSQPVMELEGLKRKAYRERVSLLSRNGGEGASQASLICLVLVLASIVSMFFLSLSVLALFGDSVVLEEFWVDHIMGSDAAFIEAPYVWALLVLVLLAITLVEPFYVGAGFAIYINSRTVTEGWDIELAFKRMSERVSGILKNTGKTIAMLLCGGLGFGEVTEASNERLEQVMEHEDFIVHTEIVEVPVSTNSSSSSGFQSGDWGFVGPLAQFIFWAVLAAIVAGLVWLIYSNRHVFTGTKVSGLSKAEPKVSSVMGMDITPESLPDDIVAAARKAWDERKYQEAMSLLYRGAISAIVLQDDVEISDGDTELDCLRSVHSQISDERGEYFDRLTHCWMRLAYGSAVPSNEDASWLMRAWPFSKGDVA